MIPIPGKSLLWKIGAIGAASFALTLAGALILEKQATHRAENERDSLREQIQNPETGYIARLRTSRDNSARLTQGIARQNLQLERLAADGERRLADAEREINRLRLAASTPAAREALTPVSEATTVCARIEEYDTRFLEVLGQ